MIDPPWKKSTGGVGHKSLQPSTHYDVQSREEIVATLSRWFEEYGVAPEAHMYMWAVNSFTADANTCEPELKHTKILVCFNTSIS